MKYSSQEQLPAARRTGPRSPGATHRVPLSGQIPKIIGESRFLQGKLENLFLRLKIFRGGTGAGECRDDGSEADSLISLTLWNRWLTAVFTRTGMPGSSARNMNWDTAGSA